MYPFIGPPAHEGITGVFSLYHNNHLTTLLSPVLSSLVTPTAQPVRYTLVLELYLLEHSLE